MKVQFLGIFYLGQSGFDHRHKVIIVRIKLSDKAVFPRDFNEAHCAHFDMSRHLVTQCAGSVVSSFSRVDWRKQSRKVVTCV